MTQEASDSQPDLQNRSSSMSQGQPETSTAIAPMYRPTTNVTAARATASIPKATRRSVTSIHPWCPAAGGNPLPPRYGPTASGNSGLVSSRPIRERKPPARVQVARCVGISPVGSSAQTMRRGSKPLCCQGWRSGAMQHARWCGRSVLVGPGSGFAEEPAVRVQSRSRWLRSRPSCPPGLAGHRRSRSTWSWRQTASLTRRLSARSASFFDFPSASLRSK
jgi:hypothetical protein